MLCPSFLLQDGWEGEARATRVYFMWALLFGARQGEEGRIISATKKTESLCDGNSAPELVVCLVFATAGCKPCLCPVGSPTHRACILYHGVL